MDRQQQALRSPAVKRLLTAILTVAGMIVQGMMASIASADPPHGDALLRDVFFVDALQGWAVGDRGVIWHTSDGGRNWRQQHSGVDAPLHSICFIDDNTGWAAGGMTDPVTHMTHGVLLSTRDAGRTWRQLPDRLLPVLKRIKFFTAASGWALGESSSLYPSGVFITTDGGRRWTPLPALASADGENAEAEFRPSGWLTGDFLDPLTGSVAGRHGYVAAVRNRTLQPSRSPRFGIRGLRRMQLSPDGKGWLIGDGGLALQTADAGLTWQTPRRPLPGRMWQFFDFRALATHGPHCWIAGTPGTCVLHSGDYGNSWQVLPTRQNLPLHGLCFVDAQHGWAVGALGTILATIDGGRTWRRQRSGGTRAAVLGFFGRPDSLPLELFAQLSGNDGYLAIAEILCRGDVDQGPMNRRTESDRVHEALVLVGACGAAAPWQFPLRQSQVIARSEQILQGWNRANDGRGLMRLREYLVREIRCWRPDIIVTHAASPQGQDPLGHLINQIVSQAVEGAGDATQFTQLVLETGLQPWKVKKVFGLLPPGRLGDVTFNAAQWASRLGRSPAASAGLARTLLTGKLDDARTSFGFRLSVNTLPQEIGRRGFFSGIMLHPGGEARRTLRESTTDMESLRRAAQKHRNVRAILKQSSGNRAASVRLIGQLQDLTKDLTPSSAGQILFNLAWQYHRKGQIELAAETMDLLVKRYPDHPLTQAALVWLVQYWSSGEVAWRLQSSQRVTVRPASAVIGQGVPSTVKQSQPARSQFSRIVADGSGREDRPSRASEVGKSIKRMHPALYAEPRVRFPLAVSQINRGFPREAQRYYLSQSRMGSHDAWQRLAVGEAWLQHRNGASPVPTAICSRAQAKPFLDGKLDDAVWRNARPIELRSRVDDDKTWRATVKLAFDDEYLYLAATCGRAAKAQYPQTDGPRPRDADLKSHDRLELLIDLDRDYATYFRLAVDHRGWTAESCWGDRSWNPQWFVAVSNQPKSWSIEAAIPLRELTGATPGAKTAWAIGLQRIVPGVGFQSWTAPASADIQPQGFGYLLFE